MKNDITFDELVMTGARSSAMKTGLGSRVPFPHCCKVKGNNLLRIRIKGKIYAVFVGAKVDREARKRGLSGS